MNADTTPLEQIVELANAARPCPFCGERLVAKETPRGWKLIHRAAQVGNLNCAAVRMEVSDWPALLAWNTRPKEAIRALQAATSPEVRTNSEGEFDEFVVGSTHFTHFEMMDEKTLWARIDHQDGTAHVFWIGVKNRKLKVSITQE